MKSIHLFLEYYHNQDNQDTRNYYRNNIFKDLPVEIIKKKDQQTGQKTEGLVKDLLTSKQKHTRGIKVRLQTGEVGRVSKILISLDKFNIKYLSKFSKQDLQYVRFDDPNGVYYTINYKDTFVGLIGYIKTQFSNFLQIIILPEYRGNDLLYISTELLMRKDNLSKLQSSINPKNIQSIKAHQKAGFKPYTGKQLDYMKIMFIKEKR